MVGGGLGNGHDPATAAHRPVPGLPLERAGGAKRAHAVEWSGLRIHAVVFDFGNVLARFDHRRACAGLSKHTGLSAERVYDLVFKSGLERLYDEGKLPSQEFYRQVCATIGALSLRYNEFGRIWCDIFDESPGAAAVVAETAAKWPSFLLSNTNELHWDVIRRMPVVRPFGDRVLLSFRIGARKPSPAIYEAVRRRTGCEPRHTLLIDDVPEYVQAAGAAGFVAERYDCTEAPAAMLATLLGRFEPSAEDEQG